MSVYISSYCKISDQSCVLNGVKSELTESETTSWEKQLYIKLGIDYPKFYKMDRLAKFAFLSTEFIIQQDGVDLNKQYEDDQIGLCFANKSSSLVSDTKFSNSYSLEKSPSPGVFVYTLPNILMGELAIRNKWYGDNRFTIHQKFDAEALITQIQLMLNSGSEAVLAGWVEVNNENVDVITLLVEKSNESSSSLELTKEVLSNLHEN